MFVPLQVNVKMKNSFIVIKKTLTQNEKLLLDQFDSLGRLLMGLEERPAGEEGKMN